MARDAGGWEKVEATSREHPGQMRCDDCGKETMTRELYMGAMICPDCVQWFAETEPAEERSDEAPAVSELELESLGQMAVWDVSLDRDKQVLQHALLRVHERYDERLADMQAQLNAVALAASLVPEIGAVADHASQCLTVIAAKVDELGDMHGLSPLDLPTRKAPRTREQIDSLNDQLEYHRSNGNNG
jgi:hypothetical protein